MTLQSTGRTYSKIIGTSIMWSSLKYCMKALYFYLIQWLDVYIADTQRGCVAKEWDFGLEFNKT